MRSSATTVRHDVEPAIARLAALYPLTEAAQSVLEQAVRRKRLVKARRELISEGTPLNGALLMVSGWAARVRLLEDGRRQIMSFLLPGDLIGNCRQPDPIAVSSVMTLTPVEFCAAPPADCAPSLDEAYAISHAHEEAYLLAQITRLGRLNAEERLSDLLLELHERLQLCGLTESDGFDLPLTQEVLADATGLTPVHMNRMLQQLRRQNDITLRSGWLVISNPAYLASRIGRLVVRVTTGAA